MKYRILVIFALAIIGIFAYKESSIIDIDEEATKAWASVYLAKTGDTKAIEELRAGLEIQDYQIIANTALRAAEKIKDPRSTKYDTLPYSKDIYRIILLDNDLDTKDITKISTYESRIDFLKSKTEKTRLYTKLARIARKKGDINAYNRLLEKAFNSSIGLPALISRTNLAEIVQLTVDCDDVENFYKYTPQIPNSYSKNIALFNIIKAGKIKKELNPKQKDKEFTKTVKFRYCPNNFFHHINNQPNSILQGKVEALRHHYIYIHKSFISNAIKMKTPDNANFPLFAYHAHLFLEMNVQKRQKMYDYYKSESLSDEQLEMASVIYSSYVDYTAFVLLKMGETQDAVSLIKTIEIDHKRNNTLRKLIRLILQDPNGYTLLKKEGLI